MLALFGGGLVGSDTIRSGVISLSFHDFPFHLYSRVIAKVPKMFTGYFQNLADIDVDGLVLGLVLEMVVGQRTTMTTKHSTIFGNINGPYCYCRYSSFIHFLVF